MDHSANAKTRTTAPVLLVANTSWYLFNFRAGTIRALREAGYRVVCLAPPDAYSEKLVTELGAEYLPVSIAGAARGLATEFGTLLATIRLVRRLRPLFVFNFTIKANIYSGIACRVTGVPFANNVSGLGTAFIHDRWLYRLVRRSYVWINSRASSLFFQNPVDLELFRAAGLGAGVPVTLLPGSGVDLERFAFRAMPEDPLRFVMVARLLGDKGVREYVEAARLVRQVRPDVQFVLIGPSGANNATAIQPDEVHRWAERGDLDYLGELPDVREELARAHVFVLPSYREGMPRTVLEAAAVGRPSIVSDVPGCRHAIEPDVTGWLCRPRDAADLAKVMVRVIDAGREALVEAGRAARALAEERFAEHRVVDAYLQCLEPRREAA